MAQIVLEHIRKSFQVSERPEGKFGVLRGAFVRKKREVEALSDISFGMEEGELVGYIGPNGAGKSTTVKVMSGILVPDGGRCEICGRVPWAGADWGFATYAGVFVMTSGIAFFTIQGLDWIYIFTNASYQVTRCPVEYLPRILKNTFTFFMPMLLISYYPASAVCGWGEPEWIGWLALPAGLVFLGASNLVWQFGVRHYKSTGS